MAKDKKDKKDKKNKVTPIRKGVSGAPENPENPETWPLRAPAPSMANVSNNPERLKSIIGSLVVDMGIYSETVLIQQREIEGLKAQIIQIEAAFQSRDEKLKEKDEKLKEKNVEILKLKQKAPPKA